MSLSVVLAVLLAAVMHAAWNALIRFHGDRLAMVTLVAVSAGLFALPGALWLGLPGAGSWPWLAASVILHTGYNVFLANAYSHGELGRVYPIARGTAPLVTLVAGALLLGETVNGWQTAGIVTLASGILVLAFEGGWRQLRRSPRGALYALVTSLFIASYTLADGMGARASGDPHAYVQWLIALHGLPLVIWQISSAPRRLANAVAVNWKAGSAGGLLSLLAYWIAIWAMTVAPIPAVAALRESSVVFAMLIGVLFLGESFSGIRALAATLVLTGLVMLRL